MLGPPPFNHKTPLMKKLILLFPLLLSLPLPAAEKLKILILDGQNNHQWETTTPLLKQILEQTDRFSVEVSTSPAGPPKGKKKEAAPAPADPAVMKEQWAKWKPAFSNYDVVISNYNGEDWPQDVQDSLVTYVRNGGGFVSYHAANNAFAKWKDYNEMIGLGGWGGRTEKSGSYLRLVDGKWSKVHEPGPCGGHGERVEFLIQTYSPDHPIMKDLPAKWMHTQDEIYHDLRGPAENLTVLGAAISNVKFTEQPLLMAISFGKGRVFHTALGHYVEALDGLGFQVTFARGTEWAATGKVTLPAPKPGELTETGPAATRPLGKKGH
jgi:uncharacterized protein